MSILSDLNEQQRLAVETTAGPLLVLSGAGTGKTKVLTSRISHILEAGLAAPWQILALTFTNKAANEMRFRVLQMRGGDASAADIWMGTFHSVCLRVLRRNAERLGLRRDFLVFGEDDQKSVMKSVLGALDLDVKKFPPAEQVEKAGARKDKGLAAAPAGDANSDFDRIFAAYNAELYRLGALDFGDLILKTLELFANAPDVLQKYRHQFKYILVDEYQDTNASQHQLLKLLSAEWGNICCVGDDDQSIYSWRGAEIRNILEFEREYPGAKIIRLETNYRSSGNILAAANSLIRHNKGRLGKELRAAQAAASGEKVRVFFAFSDLEEARMIADAVKSGCQAANGEVQSVAVLIRAGSLSRVYEDEFAAAGLPYRLVGATKFYDRAEIRDAVAYARLLCHPFDDISFLRVISRPRRGFGDTALAKLRGYARAGGCGVMQAMRAVQLSGRQRQAADEFARAFDFDWGAMAPADAVKRLLEDSGYMKMWRDSKDTDAEIRLDNLNDLLTGVISKYDSLPEFLEHAALMMTEDQDGGEAQAAKSENMDAIAIMTIHAAKGLEFDTVFCPAWEDGIFPNEMAVDDGGLEEERRLAYVAITRARRRCVISCAASRVLYGARQFNAPSKFIGELDPEFTQDAGPLPRRGYGGEGRLAKRADERRAARAERTERAERMVGKLVSHPDLGSGVVIEENGDMMTVAFRDRGIKKVEKSWLEK